MAAIDPRNKTGNDQRISLFAATGIDAWALVTVSVPQYRSKPALA